MTGRRPGFVLEMLWTIYMLEAGAFLVVSPFRRFWIQRVVNPSPVALQGLLLSPHFRSLLVGIGVLHLLAAMTQIERWRRERASRAPVSRARSAAAAGQGES